MLNKILGKGEENWLCQEGSTSANIFNHQSDQALCKLQKVPNSLRIRIQEVNILMVGDNFVLVSCSSNSIQQMIHIANQHNSNKLFSDNMIRQNTKEEMQDEQDVHLPDELRLKSIDDLKISQS